MANIFLTKKCNLKCPYCFADEFVNKEKDEVTLENFNKILEFIKTDPNERVGLIGGEPTLHPHFADFISILKNDEQVKSAIIYTNGLELDKYIQLLKDDKFRFLINCNSPLDLGETLYSKLKSNIELLAKELPDKYTLGINLYSKDMNYSYIFDLLKLTNNHNVRFSTALPNDYKEATKDVLKNFNEFKPFLFEFFNDCYSNKIVPSNDCNSIPSCLLDVEDKKVMIKLKLLADKFNVLNTVQTANLCEPVIDILPDLNAVRCFGLSKNLKVPIDNFKSIQNLRKYFVNKIDLYANLSFLNEDCEDCKVRLLNKCGVCFTYKLCKMNKLKQAVNDLI